MYTYCLRKFIYSPLSSEQNRCRKDTLNEFAADAFVQPLDALLFEDRKESIPRRLVF
jgi:hypothetical protein